MTTARTGTSSAVNFGSMKPFASNVNISSTPNPCVIFDAFRNTSNPRSFAAAIIFAYVADLDLVALETVGIAPARRRLHCNGMSLHSGANALLVENGIANALCVLLINVTTAVATTVTTEKNTHARLNARRRLTVRTARLGARLLPHGAIVMSPGRLD
jgi:hypothetical protein